MRYAKGEWKVGYKDTWSVDTTLNKIILAYLKKLYSFKDRDGFGVPRYYCEKQGAIQGIGFLEEGLDFDAAIKLRIADLEELIWTFDSSNEPDIRNYNYTYDFTEDGMVCSNEAERDRYHADLDAYWMRREAGYKLFGEVFNTLDW